MLVSGDAYRTIWWEAGDVVMIDQRLLPHRFVLHRCHTSGETALAIREMVVRGAGAIGAAAGYGLAQAAVECLGSSWEALQLDLDRARAALAATRPTAQNLFFALGEVYAAAIAQKPSATEARSAALARAAQLADEDSTACRDIGEVGRPLLGSRTRVLTHCNAGWLAFVDWGSALSPIYAAARAGQCPFVLVDETRPRGQGAALTAWELTHERVDHVVIADNAAGYFFQRREVDLVIVGADRIAMNGDVANKIGTYEKALLAHTHGVPFYVASPLTTIDTGCASAAAIPIEERSPDELRFVCGQTDKGEIERVQVTYSPARNPAFDVTPANYVTGLITPRGIFPASPAGIRFAIDR